MRIDAATRRISFRTPQRVRTREDVLPIWCVVSEPTLGESIGELGKVLTSKTRDTLSKKATIAFATRFGTPTFQISFILMSGTSNHRLAAMFMSVQMGA